jgi:CRISPR-associated protein Csm4
MDTLKLAIRPLTAFGSPIKGDTLFGHFCWAIANRLGEARLAELLQGYTDGAPFLIASDAFPSGYIPRPALPLEFYTRLQEEDRKRVKKRQWLAVDKLDTPVVSWLGHCLTEQEVARLFSDDATDIHRQRAQPHNSIHRGLNTTHGGEFAPYSTSQYWFAPGLLLDIWLVFDAQRMDAVQLAELASGIGQSGFGRDASTGLGKFEVSSAETRPLPQQQGSRSALTLAPCAPQGLDLEAAQCFYEPFTRFGRHGDRAVLSGKPFKNPVLMADSGAIITGDSNQKQGFVGQGLGGAGLLSNTLPETVHQGYAPCIGIHLKEAGA